MRCWLMWVVVGVVVMSCVARQGVSVYDTSTTQQQYNNNNENYDASHADYAYLSKEDNITEKAASNLRDGNEIENDAVTARGSLGDSYDTDAGDYDYYDYETYDGSVGEFDDTLNFDTTKKPDNDIWSVPGHKRPRNSFSKEQENPDPPLSSHSNGE